MSRKCAKCGAVLEEDEMFCGECGELCTDEGNEGILENYGSMGLLEELQINAELQVKTGQTKTFKNKKIIFFSKIKTEEDVKLEFINCEIVVDKNAFKEELDTLCIIETQGSEIIFDKCTFTNIKQIIIKAHNLGESETNVTVQGSHIKFCSKIFDGGFGGIISIRNSYIDLPVEDELYSFIKCKNVEMYNTTICGKTVKMERGYELFVIDELLRLDKCHFGDIQGLVIRKSVEAYKTDFENCCINISRGGKYEYNKDGGIFNECKLKKCSFERSYSNDVVRFENVELLDCVGQLPTTYMKNVVSDGGFLVLWRNKEIKLLSCHFSNWSYRYFKEARNTEGCYIFTGDTSDEAAIATVANSTISDCQFENLDLGSMSLIGCYPLEYSACVIKNCQFRNINTGSNGILKRHRIHWKRGLFSSKSVTETLKVDISNCTGL